MRGITISDLNGFLKNHDNFVTLTDYQVSFDFAISSGNFDCKGLTFVNCEFLNNLQLQDVELNCGIKFKSCTFKKNIDIKDISISQYDQQFNFDNDNLLFENCVIKKRIFFYPKNKIFRDTKFKKTVIQSIEMSYLNSKEGGLDFIDCTINDLCRIGHNHFLTEIRFQGTNSKGRIQLENNTVSFCTFLDNIFESDAWIWYGNATNGITFNNGQYNGDFKIQSVNSKGCLTIINARFDSQFLVEYETKNGDALLSHGCPKIYIRDSEFNNGFIVNGGIDIMSYYHLDEICIEATKKLKGEISFNRFELSNLKISGTNYDSNIIFDNNIFEKILFERFTNFGTIQFIEARARHETGIHTEFASNNSPIGKIFLTNVSFEYFQNIAIDNSNFTGVIASNVKWFTLNQLEKPDEIKKLSIFDKFKRTLYFLVCNVEKLNSELAHYRRKRELFRQLKFAMQQQGNGIQSLVFKQYEMKFFTMELRLSETIFNKDCLIMELSRTNSHGQNWFKPLLLLTLIITPIFASLILLTYNKDHSDFVTSFSGFLRVCANILNPTFSLKDIFGEKIFSGFLVAICVSYRVFYAYFVFQIISAFRKYIK